MRILDGKAAAAAIRADLGVTERQKQVLLEIYESFRRENEGRPIGQAAPADVAGAVAAARTSGRGTAAAAKAGKPAGGPGPSRLTGTDPEQEGPGQLAR